MDEPMELAELQVFASIVDARSLTRAASELGLPRPTVGRRLARLEERLGVRLLRRTTRRIALTDAGATLYEHAKSVLDAAREAEAAVRQHTGAVRGELRVALPPIFTDEMLGVLCSFAEAYPEVRLHLTFTAKHVDVLRDADVALRSGPLLEPGVVTRTLHKFELLAYAAPAYLEVCGAPSKPTDLARHACLVFAAEGHPPFAQWPLRSGRTVRVRSSLTSNSFLLLREAARRARGIALLPSSIAEGDLGTGRLVRVLPDHLQLKTQLAIVYQDRQTVTPAVRAFIDAMCDGLRSLGRRPR